jgi:hypothetical protein
MDEQLQGGNILRAKFLLLEIGWLFMDPSNLRNQNSAVCRISIQIYFVGHCNIKRGRTLDVLNVLGIDHPPFPIGSNQQFLFTLSHEKGQSINFSRSNSLVSQLESWKLVEKEGKKRRWPGIPSYRCWNFPGRVVKSLAYVGSILIYSDQ